MKWIISLITAFFIWRVFSQNITTGAGVAVHIKQEMFDNLKSTVIKKFIDSIETGDLDDIKIVKDVKIFKILLDMTSMKLKQFKLDLDDSYLRLRDKDPYLELFVSNFSVNFTFDFNLRSDPAFVEDKGDGRIEFKPTSLYIGYEIKNVKGKPVFVTKSAIMNWTDLNIYANGTADFSKVITQLGAFLKDSIKSKINDYLVSVVDATITPAINNMISSSFAAVYEINKDIVVNFTSTVNPKFENSHMTLFFKGEVTPKDEPRLPFADKLQVPSSTKQDGKYIQIAVSDYIFNSTIYSLYRKGYLQIDTKNINGTENPVPISYFFLLFPSLAQKYSPDTPVWFKGIAKEETYKPYMEISNNTAIAYSDFEIEMSGNSLL